jgi:hypothetical protein
MSRFRFLIAAAMAVVVPGVALAQQKGPMPRDVSPDRGVDEVVRKINQHFDEFWSRNSITPAPIADDGEFLRRLSLDLIGRIPTPAEARAFVENKDPDKRSKKIEELLGRPGFLNHFATVYRQLWVPQTMENPQFQFAGPQFETWIKNRMRDDVPMDKIVRELLTVQTLFAGRGAQAFQPASQDSPFLFLQVNEFKPENVASVASRLFMGIKIECAQCHNHPFASYTKEQFWEQAAFFAEIQPAIANVSDVKLKREIRIPDPNKTITVTAKYFDDGREPKWDSSKSPRQTFADWLTSAKNPYFAKNMVNRTWAHFLGLGIVDPVDEPSEDNPAVIPELLDDLAKAYVERGFDTRFLIRAITRSKVYQLTSRQTDPSQSEPRQFARANIKAMTGEQLFDSLATATGFIDPTPLNQRQFGGGPRREFIARFSSAEKITEKQTSILQALTLMNGRFINEQTSMERSQFLAGVIDAPFLDTKGKLEAMYLAAHGRQPTPEEYEKHTSYIDRGGVSGDKKKAVTDVFWSLLNSSEFMLNH